MFAHQQPFPLLFLKRTLSSAVWESWSPSEARNRGSSFPTRVWWEKKHEYYIDSNYTPNCWMMSPILQEVEQTDETIQDLDYTLETPESHHT